MKKILNLEYRQKIMIEKNLYTVLAMLKYSEGSSYWFEYILKKDDSNETYYLDIEPVGKYALHKMIDYDGQPKLVVIYEDEVYNLFQKGNAKVQTFYGNVGVGLNEVVEYYEYINDNKLFTIEKWSDLTEVSVGRYIDKRKIKVLKIEEE